jgi:hypothetical protein
MAARANLIDAVEKQNGVITILWHNTHIFDEKLPQTLTRDENLTDVLRENPRILPPEECLDYVWQRNM